MHGVAINDGNGIIYPHQGSKEVRDMKITSVKALVLSAAIPEEQRWRSDLGVRRKSDTTVVVVETDEGITGYGSAQGTPLVCKAVVEEQLAPALIGGHSQPIFGRRGETVAAISGVDIALWDILGKSVGQPVYKLLGASRDRAMPAAVGRLRGKPARRWEDTQPKASPRSRCGCREGKDSQ
jgi:L-alanine-DL-glutamate epimerase-like enolase superfamily enzyme